MLLEISQEQWAVHYNYVSQGMGFDASRVVPVANENRPINKAVRYFIKAK